MLCLARAILRNNKIIVIDEATANVDLETDNLIQGILREKFEDKTMIIIAHRLFTIIDTNKVVFMKDGKIMEYDIPYLLLCNGSPNETKITKSNGHFAGLVLATGEDVG